jgi:hypothetical protein
MLKTNRIFHCHSFLALFLLLLLSVIFPAWAEETETKSKESVFILEVKDNLINLRAEQASFKEILSDLEKKTGIKVNIFDGVEDGEVVRIFVFSSCLILNL